MRTVIPSATPAFAGNLILWWVRFYTLGLASASRDRRLGQIGSDLWEHFLDRSEQGVSPALIGLEALGRAARGAVADLLWRSQLEEPQMQINIPIDRIAGASLILLVGAIFLSTNVAGYDPSMEGFDGELRRLASIKGWQVGAYTALQVLSGIGMLAGAVVLYLTLKRHSTAPVILAAVAMAGAGLLTLVTSALYATAAELADEFVTATPEHRDAVLTVARAFLLMLGWMVPVTAFMLAISVGGFSFVTARHRLVPQWLGYVGGGSVVAFTIAFVSDTVTDLETIPWVFFIIGFLLMLLWLLAAGAWLLLGGSKEALDDQQPVATEEIVTPSLAHEPNHEQPLTMNRWLVGTMVAFVFASLAAVGILGIPGLLILMVPVGVLITTMAYSRARRIRLPEGQP